MGYVPVVRTSPLSALPPFRQTAYFFSASTMRLIAASLKPSL